MKNIENYSVFIKLMVWSARLGTFAGIVFGFMLGCDFFVRGHHFLGIIFIISSFILLHFGMPWRSEGIYIGNGKIKVKLLCNELYYKAGHTKVRYFRYHADEFKLSELSKYGFSREPSEKLNRYVNAAARDDYDIMMPSEKL